VIPVRARQENTTVNWARNTLAIIATGNSAAYPTATRELRAPCGT